MSITVYAPVSGTVAALTTVPDPVFSAGIVGPGWAVDPFPGGLTVLSPCTGVVKKATPHAYIIVAPGGYDILVHLGVDTVKLKGQGFLSLVGDGREVSAGQPIAVWNTSVAQKAELSICTPVVCMGHMLPTRLSLQAEAKIEAGKPLFTID